MGLCIFIVSLFALTAVSAQPVIVAQPQNQTNLLGSTATFQVMATGTPPLSYQWRSYASAISFTNIFGATNDSLVLTNVQPTQRRFGVVVSNTEGTVTSTLATLTVQLPPGITLQPVSAVASIGQSVSFSVTASGTAPFRYQWQRNGEDLPGRTNSSLSFAAAQPTNDAAYRVVASNPYGAVTSRVATLSVLPPVAALQARTFTNAPPGPLPYRLFIPTNYSPGERYPLVMFLHGVGERGNDNALQLSAWPDCLVYVSYSRQLIRPAFFVAPQCPVTRAWNDPVMVTQLLALFDALAAEFSIDTNRVSVTGLSMGGYGVWALLQQRPAFFAAAVPICGGGNPGLATSIRDVPVWDFHAANDGTVPVTESRSMISALRQAGGTPVYTEYASGGHVIWPGAYRNPFVVEWTFAQRRAQSPTTDPRVSFLNPTEQNSFTTGAAVLDLSGAASAYGEPIVQVRWTNTLARAGGIAGGTNTWTAVGIPLQRPGANRIVVTATTTSWSAEFGGVTTFNAELAVQQAAPIYATITRSEANLVLNWIGGAPPFRVERLNAVANGDWIGMLDNAVAPVALTNDAGSAFYRIAGQ
jgi:poly(3-hydroxybutyrate) depolymerase